MGPLIIPVLRKLKMGQTEREDGVKSHLNRSSIVYSLGIIDNAHSQNLRIIRRRESDKRRDISVRASWQRLGGRRLSSDLISLYISILPRSFGYHAFMKNIFASILPYLGIEKE